MQQLPVGFDPVAINNAGQVAGYANSNSVASIFSNGTTHSLGTLGGSASPVLAINNSGEAAGVSYIAGNGTVHAFLYDGATMLNLGTFVGGSYSNGRAINDVGEVAGYAATAGGADHAFLYNGAAMLDIGTLGGASSYAYGVNNAGEVVGISYTTANTGDDAFLYNGTTMVNLGTLGGFSSQATAINNAGDVVGFSLTAGNASDHAFFSTGVSMTDLGTLGGATSDAYAISDAGDVVGDAQDATNTYRAAIWQSNGAGYTAYSLAGIVNTGGVSGWLFNEAIDISSDGRYILATGSHDGGPVENIEIEESDLPVTGTPEPASVLLVATGFLGVVAGARSRVLSGEVRVPSAKPHRSPTNKSLPVRSDDRLDCRWSGISRTRPVVSKMVAILHSVAFRAELISLGADSGKLGAAVEIGGAAVGGAGAVSGWTVAECSNEGADWLRNGADHR